MHHGAAHLVVELHAHSDLRSHGDRGSPRGRGDGRDLPAMGRLGLSLDRDERPPSRVARGRARVDVTTAVSDANMGNWASVSGANLVILLTTTASTSWIAVTGKWTVKTGVDWWSRRLPICGGASVVTTSKSDNPGFRRRARRDRERSVWQGNKQVLACGDALSDRIWAASRWTAESCSTRELRPWWNGSTDVRLRPLRVRRDGNAEVERARGAAEHLQRRNRLVYGIEADAVCRPKPRRTGASAGRSR